MSRKCETCPFNPEVKLCSLKEQYIELARNPPLESSEWPEYTAQMTSLEERIREYGVDL